MATVVAVVHVTMSTTEDLYALEDDLFVVCTRQKASHQDQHLLGPISLDHPPTQQTAWKRV